MPKVEEKRENFSPRKLRKPGERESNFLLLESYLFSRKLFCGENPKIGFLLEKTLFCTGRTRCLWGPS
jgi:hypothetical protein